MNMSEYQRLDGLGLAGLLRAGTVSARQLMQCAIDAAEQVNPALNALCHMDFQRSLELAGAADLRGPFGGLPFLLKDSGLASRRLPSGLGSRLFEGVSFAYDATLVKRFGEAGFIPFARSTVPEFSMAPTTEGVANGGPTRNPWDPSRSSGGSSGGAAVAVSAGIVPVAHANDGGGSIRIPASCCGLFGLKPSRGRVPMGPARGEGWGGLAAEGVISRSVRDTAAALDAIAGYEAGAPYAAPPAPTSYLALLSQDFARPLRIITWTQTWLGNPVDPECLAAVQRAQAILRGAGHEVVDAPPPDLDYAAFTDALITVLAANAAITVQGRAGTAPVAEWRPLLEPAIFDAYERGSRLSAGDYANAINLFHRIGRRIESAMAGYDLALTPTLTRPPVKLGELSMQTDFVSFRRAVSNYTTFLPIMNASGQPAATLPLHWSREGLPIGVQLIGHFGREDQILQLAGQIERLAPWFDRRPPLGSGGKG